VDDLEINELVTRLSRPHSSGGVVIERAAILAAGADFPAVMHWITAHAGTPDTIVTPARSRGLHGGRLNDGTAPPAPLRFVLPAGALN
jgi:enterochelin esterase-like enzyme